MANCFGAYGVKIWFASARDAQVFYEELVYCIINQACTQWSAMVYYRFVWELWYQREARDTIMLITADGNWKIYFHRMQSRNHMPALFSRGRWWPAIECNCCVNLWICRKRILNTAVVVGTNYSHIRGEGEKLSGDWYFQRIDGVPENRETAQPAIKVISTTRRAAKWTPGSWHPRSWILSTGK